MVHKLNRMNRENASSPPSTGYSCSGFSFTGCPLRMTPNFVTTTSNRIKCADDTPCLQLPHKPTPELLV